MMWTAVCTCFVVVSHLDEVSRATVGGGFRAEDFEAERQEVAGRRTHEPLAVEVVGVVGREVWGCEETGISRVRPSA